MNESRCISRYVMVVEYHVSFHFCKYETDFIPAVNPLKSNTIIITVYV